MVQPCRQNPPAVFRSFKADHHIQENKLKTGEVINMAEAAKGSDAKDNHGFLQKCGLGLDGLCSQFMKDLGLSSPTSLDAEVLS